MIRHSLALLFLGCFHALAGADKPLDVGPEFTTSESRIWSFKTEPQMLIEHFHAVKRPKNQSLLAPGYIYMNAMVKSPQYGFGLSIYTDEGELVWRGSHDHMAQNLHPSDFNGSIGTHLSYYTRWVNHRFPNLPEGDIGRPRSTYGHLVILDSTYKEVIVFKDGFDKLAINGHAFEIHDEGHSATTIIARPRNIDLTKHGGPKHGWVLNQCIQDWELPSGDEAFHWCYYDSGLSIWESKLIPSINPATMAKPWDFLHTNAVTKTIEGDYIVSIRHADTLIKLAGLHNTQGKKPGELIWRLGGKSNNFTMRGFDTRVGFSRQHDVRVLSLNKTTEVISLFNNAWDWFYPPSQMYSEGQIISINNETMEATRIRVYPHPRRSEGRKHSLSDGRGSMQVLPNGNVIIGWGHIPDITEFSENGTVLYHVRYTRNQNTPQAEFSYRVYRAPWVGKPYWDPKLVGYTPDCNPKSPLTAYVSHNGATEIKNWRLKAARSADGPWEDLGEFPKKGFETTVRLKKTMDFVPYLSAEALDEKGDVLGSTVSEVFVPKDEVKAKFSCKERSCKRHFEYRQEGSKARSCHVEKDDSSASSAYTPLDSPTNSPAFSPMASPTGSPAFHPGLLTQSPASSPSPSPSSDSGSSPSVSSSSSRRPSSATDMSVSEAPSSSPLPSPSPSPTGYPATPLLPSPTPTPVQTYYPSPTPEPISSVPPPTFMRLPLEFTSYSMLAVLMLFIESSVWAMTMLFPNTYRRRAVALDYAEYEAVGAPRI